MLSGWQEEEEEGVDKCMQPRGRRQRSGELVVCGQELGPWPTGPLPHLASTGQGGQVSGLGPPCISYWPTTAVTHPPLPLAN